MYRYIFKSVYMYMQYVLQTTCKCNSNTNYRVVQKNVSCTLVLHVNKFGTVQISTTQISMIQISSLQMSTYIQISTCCGLLCWCAYAAGLVGETLATGIEAFC